MSSIKLKEDMEWQGLTLPVIYFFDNKGLNYLSNCHG